MQPEPTEPSTQTSYIASPESPATPFQYGILSNEDSLQDHRGQIDVSHSPDQIPTPWNEVNTFGASGGEEEVGRLRNTVGGSKRPKPSAQLIAEYENAMLPAKQKRINEGPEFKIVKGKVVSLDATQLEDFPNGTLPRVNVLPQIDYPFLKSIIL